MNPLYAALTGGQNAVTQAVQQTMNNQQVVPMSGPQSVLQRAQQLMQNPVQAVRQMIPGLPENIANDPNAIIGWLQQTGRVSPQMMQTAQQLQQMMGKR